MTSSKPPNAPADRAVRVALLGASFATRNLGVNALAIGAVRSVLQQYPDAEVFLLDYGMSPSARQIRLDGREISVPLLNLRFSKKFYLPNNIARLLLESLALRLVPSRSLRERLAAKSPWLGRIWQTELFASLAGGDSFSDIYGFKRLVYVTLPQLLVLAAGKRLILLPQTLGPFRRRMSKTIAKYILRRAERVYTRDHRGVNTARALIGEHMTTKKIAFCYDLGFVLDPVAPTRLEVEGMTHMRSDGSPVVGLNVSGLLFKGGHTQNNAFGLSVNYRELAVGLVDLLVRQKHVRVLLVPHVSGEGPGSEGDGTACRLLYEHFRKQYEGRIGLIRDHYNESEIKHVIGLCDFFIGSRMHACIAALSQKVPALAVAYSDKFIGVMEAIGFESLVADARGMSQKEILEKTAEVYERRQSIHMELKVKVPQIKEAVLTLFRDISLPGYAGRVVASKPLEAPAIRQAQNPQ